MAGPEDSGSGEEEGDHLHHVLLRDKIRHLAADTWSILAAAIEQSGIGAWSLDDLTPANVPATHSFELEDQTPIRHMARRLPLHQNNVVREEIDKMLKAGIITPSVSGFSVEVLIASKKDDKSRFCVDYRTLNRRMKADRWPLPRMEEIIDNLEGSEVLTTLDLFSGYWQVRMAEYCKEKTTFVCGFGTFQFEVMPFGLMNARSTFQKMMDQLFRNLRFVRVYLESVWVFSKSVEEHVLHLIEVLRVIAENSLKLRIAKCNFAQSQTRLLRDVVSSQGIKVAPQKVRAMREEPVLTNITELRSFLGLAGYYRRFIPGFAGISTSLHEATSVKKSFRWTKEMLKAFEGLKLKLISPPVLAFPHIEEPFHFETDASSVAVGAALSQRKKDGKVHLVQYASRTITEAGGNYSACEREVLAVIFSLKKFRVYLLSTQKLRLSADH